MRRFPFWAYCACAAIWVFMSVGQQGVVGRTMYVLTAIAWSVAATLEWKDGTK